jgi:hypothetical protein
MPLFRSSPKSSVEDLHPPFREMLSAEYRADAVEPREYQEALNQLVKHQDAILMTIPHGESLMFVAPCFMRSYAGIAALTDRTAFYFGGISHATKRLPIKEIVSVEKLTSEDGYFIVTLIGKEAAPFSSVRYQSGAGSMTFMKHSVDVYFSKISVVEHFLTAVNTLRNRANS